MPLSVLHPDFFLVYQILYVSVLNPKHGRMEGEVVQTSPDLSTFSAFILLLFESIFLSEVYSYSISFSFYVKYAWECLKYGFGRSYLSNGTKTRLYTALNMFFYLYFQYQQNYIDNCYSLKLHKPFIRVPYR